MSFSLILFPIRKKTMLAISHERHFSRFLLICLRFQTLSFFCQQWWRTEVRRVLLACHRTAQSVYTIIQFCTTQLLLLSYFRHLFRHGMTFDLYSTCQKKGLRILPPLALTFIWSALEDLFVFYWVWAFMVKYLTMAYSLYEICRYNVFSVEKWRSSL